MSYSDLSRFIVEHIPYLIPYVFIVVISIVFLFHVYNIKKRHYKLFRFLHNYLNIIISARYGNLNSKIEDGVDIFTKQLSKNTNMLLESIMDRDKMIREYIEKEKERQELKQDFISGFAHDLKVPIIAQDNTYDLLLSEIFGKLTDEQETAIKNLKISNDDLRKLILNLLDIQKYENNSLFINKEKTELNELINEIIEQDKSIFKIRNKNIVFNSKQSKIYCLIDRFLVKRAINNLIANAVSHCKNSNNIFINLSKTEKYVEISVIDEGGGINENDINNIFKKYYTSSKKYSNTSMGLGLYISNKIIALHNGKITAKNNQNKGASFSIVLPLKDVLI